MTSFHRPWKSPHVRPVRTSFRDQPEEGGMGRIYMNLRFACLMVRFVVGEKKNTDLRPILGGLKKLMASNVTAWREIQVMGGLPKIGGFPPKIIHFNKAFSLFSPSILG